MVREIGMNCWPYGNPRGCDAQFNITLKRGERREDADKRLEREAGEAGWCIGHYDAQGFYVCPDHKTCIYDPVPLNAGRKPIRVRRAAREA
jgi:hypothetical protein